MKKKILGGIAFAAVALALAFNLSMKQNTNQLSGLAMANVEALANDESGPVVIPCASSQGNTCDFSCIVGGVTTTCTIKDHKKS